MQTVPHRRQPAGKKTAHNASEPGIIEIDPALSPMSLAAIAVAPGVSHFPGFLDRAAQEALRDEVLGILERAPLFRPRMPRTGKPFSVRMSNCGALGWVSDERGYRYQPTHPETGVPGRRCRQRSSPLSRRSPLARRRPRPASSISTTAARGWACTRTGTKRNCPPPSSRYRLAIRRCSGSAGFSASAPTRSFRLASGDAMSLAGEGRLAFHGVDRIIAGSSTLLPDGGRINLTLRRVTRADA